MYGLNQGAAVTELQLDEAATSTARDRDFDLRTALFKAAPEQLRPQRIVRIGLVQNKIVLPTTAPYEDQAKVRVLSVPNRRRPWQPHIEGGGVITLRTCGWTKPSAHPRQACVAAQPPDLPGVPCAA